MKTPTYDAPATQRQASAAENAERYRVLTELLPLPMLIHVAGVIRYVNQECVKLLGGDNAGEFIGSSILDVIHPDYRAAAMSRVQRILQGEPNVESVELKLVCKNGSQTWIETTGIAIPSVDPQAIYVVGKDIADRKRMELQETRRLSELEALYLLSNTVSTASSLEQVYAAAMDAILKLLKADRVSILLFDVDSVMRFKAWRGLSDAYRQGADGHSPWTRDAEKPESIFIDDIELDAGMAHFRPLAKAEGLRAFGFVPLVQQGRLLGKFMVYFNQPHRFSTTDSRLASTIAFHIAFAIERKLTNESLRENKNTLQMILRCAPDAVFICSQQGQISYANDHAVSLLGYSHEELYAMTVFDLVPPDWRARYRQAAKSIASSSEPQIREIYLLRKDGSKIPMELNASVLPNQQVYGSCRDISERKRLDRDLRVAAIAFETQEGILVTNAQGIILKVNQAFTSITGYSAGEAVGKTPALLKSGKHDARFYQAMWAALNQHGFWHGEIWNRRKDASVYPEQLTITAVTNQANDVINYVANFADITQQKKNEEKIHSLAFFDSLTRLPNRRLLLDRLHQSMAASARHGHYGAVIFIDLDNFKSINETKGHEVGDLMLIEVAKRLPCCVPDFDTVSHLGGDNFVVLMESSSGNPIEAATQAELVAQTIRVALGKPYLLARQEFHSTPSIGIALFQGHEESMTDLLKHAEIAMYQAKTAGRNAVRFYDVTMQSVLETRITLEEELRKAINEQQFQLHYQIQVKDGLGVIGVEALLRWMHPERGLILPANFIPLAEETQLILPIGEWVMRSACDQIKVWSANPAKRHLRVAVNVSPLQFSQDDFVAQVKGILEQSGIDATRLKLELTESLMLHDVSRVIDKMHQIKALGVGFAMDDFGTGFSSLSLLKKLPLDQLKIDQSFVSDLVTDQNDQAIVHAIITMAEAFGLNVIAEGVETGEQRAQLTCNGCHTFQGDYFGKPVHGDQLDKVLSLHSS